MNPAALDEELVAIGLRPTLRARSRQTRMRILDACSAAMFETDFAALSVRKICQAADCSVGAFYSHFATKDLLLKALVVSIALEAQEDIDEACREATSQTALQNIVALTVRNYRDRQPFLRIAIRSAVDDGEVWTPIRRFGASLVRAYLGTFAEKPSIAQEARIRFGFQAMYGLLNNELTHMPGPYELNHPELVDRLCGLFKHEVPLP